VLLRKGVFKSTETLKSESEKLPFYSLGCIRHVSLTFSDISVLFSFYAILYFNTILSFDISLFKGLFCKLPPPVPTLLLG